MSSYLNPLSKPFAAAAVNAGHPKYSYSRKQACGFDLWQAHLRQVGGSVEGTYAAQLERGLPRNVVAG